MKRIISIIMVSLFVTLGFAQEKLITGKVVAASDANPIPGVNVFIKGSQTGVQTDFDGIYAIEAKEGDVLVFSFLGFSTAEMEVKKGNVINVSLQPDISTLDEVVVVGYATQRRMEVTGAVTTVSSSRKSKRKNANVDQALQGRVAGVNVQTGQGTPGSAKTIKIKGVGAIKNAKPLYVVNGVPVSEYKFQQISTDSINSINVLKDASATSIYGGRGVNGVVIITTKDEEKHQKKEPLYIVDGKPIDKGNNLLIEKLPEKEIKSKSKLDSKEAKEKYGKLAKHGCIIIDTQLGNFQILENESYAVIHENPFENVRSKPLSTFSIDVDKAGYSNIRRMINNGMSIPADAVKIEEMINYFDYDYPQPTDEHPFSITTNVAKTPWNEATKLVRVGLKGKEFQNDDLPASNLTFLIDVSGSMNSQNKLPLLKQAFKLLVNQLREKDKVAIVVYAGAAGMVLPPTNGDQKEKILQALDNLQAGGSTAGGAGIELAYNTAMENFKKKGNNRVILATDGDFNVGASSDKAMEDLIEEKRKSGVFLSVLGFGMGNYKDSKLETLADKGNGNHAYIDNMQEAQKVFGKEFGGTLYTIAKDVKIQVEFNPKKVQAYRLIGYENRMLAAEDFTDDTKDAGELGAGHTVTALYEVIPVGVESEYLRDVPDLKYADKKIENNYNDELFTVKFRYKKPNGDTSIEMVQVHKDEVKTMPDDFSFAAAVALFGMELKGSSFDNNADVSQVIQLADQGKAKDKDGYRSEFIRLVKSVQNL
ncbi:Ca-activated chloride channel family protein [Pustulibacterium marinum]|uniref:Ca-activated chloride channel family protein n=1 Tax=Pustulibacterium marinum TaxID=1224947 RepID=A0A1I7GCN3_9FLAO|nr:VWA domain-containing protein [Pustulibacterium marinum]SFU46242.1 Ca-activated chloride channel family protein [Pustulibacterium marinum]